MPSLNVKTLWIKMLLVFLELVEHNRFLLLCRGNVVFQLFDLWSWGMQHICVRKKCVHSELCVRACVTFQTVLEVCELRCTVGECEESAATRRTLLFTDTLLWRRLFALCACVCVCACGCLMGNLFVGVVGSFFFQGCCASRMCQSVFF